MALAKSLEPNNPKIIGNHFNSGGSYRESGSRPHAECVRPHSSSNPNPIIKDMKKILLCAVLLGSLISSQATIYQYLVYLDGPTEPSPSPGLGTGQVFYDDAAHSLTLEVSFSGLLGTVTATHIHAATADPFTGTAGVAVTTPSLPGFPTGVTSGAYSNTLDLTASSSFNPTYVTANGGTLASAEAAFKSAMDTGRAYWNIHTTSYGGGEIRGFLTVVPEPSSTALAAMAGIVLLRRLRRW